jgi:hypothetical protein
VREPPDEPVESVPPLLEAAVSPLNMSIVPPLGDKDVPGGSWPALPLVETDPFPVEVSVMVPLDNEEVPVVPLPAKLAAQRFDGHGSSGSRLSGSSPTIGFWESLAAGEEEGAGGPLGMPGFSSSGFFSMRRHICAVKRP